METAIILQKSQVATSVEKAETKVTKTKKYGFYAKKRCFLLYGLMIGGIGLILLSKFILGTLILLFSAGLLFLLKDLDEALTLDLNFSPSDEVNHDLKKDLDF
ncbi:hypothetical protein [Aquiflexum lacus]|uniref:hypothetical protein n=1 Tax=Aquiflexum lacus TaxID=2483805 RepID=UPI001893051A|nr:hypothetical protein [Aquiflexum lacus]